MENAIDGSFRSLIGRPSLLGEIDILSVSDKDDRFGSSSHFNLPLPSDDMRSSQLHVVLVASSLLALAGAAGVVRSIDGTYNVLANRSASVGTLQPEKQISDSKAASPFLGESADARRPEQIDRTLSDIRKDEVEHDKLQAMHIHDEERDYSEEESDEELDEGDSALSEERNPEDFVGRDLKQVVPGQAQTPPETVSIIERAFNNKRTFSCPRIKQDFVTGRSVGDLSPEDFGIIAAMGDSLATGTGLWPQTGIEFRGAAFPIGGDATIDGLVTIPNILREFHDQELVGVSHGMGTREQLPIHQLNVAEEGATSASMPQQARELVRRLRLLREVDTWNTWTMIIVAIGTEEICGHCNAPDYDALVSALDILNRGVHKAFVVLLGPVHVSSAYRLKANLLKNRCACSKEQSNEFMEKISDAWTQTFEDLQEHVNSVKRRTFGM
uniref:Lipase_GDSL domain-containing protein n=1 Tax=Steinernema glaseri TaxID=37863 RepID=A0A1I7ZL35_9BILA